MESVDTTDLKSVGQCPWGFKSPRPYCHSQGILYLRWLNLLHNIMHESTLNLFCDHCDDLDIDNAFMLAMEEEAAKLEITVDYYMEEFM